MRALTILKRVRNLERQTLPSESGFTLEALYRSIWREDPIAYRKLMADCPGSGLGVLLPRFEREDAERARRRQG